MRTIVMVSETIEDNCIGCKMCETVCIFGAIKVVDKKARVDESKCMACLSCCTICPNGALTIRYLAEPKILKYDYSDVDPIAIKELCNKAGINDPERVICLCTLTKAKEAAAAIIRGARTRQELAAMTGLNSECTMWCLDPTVRLLEAYGCDPKINSTAKSGYPMQGRLRDITEEQAKELSKKYPGYFIEEDRKLWEKGKLPTITELL